MATFPRNDSKKQNKDNKKDNKNIKLSNIGYDYYEDKHTVFCAIIKKEKYYG